MSEAAKNENTVQLTRLLHARSGDGWDDLLPLVYEELRVLADRRMGGERADHTLQATALVHEAWMRLRGDQEMEWSSRRHFFGAAAEAMRRILVDHARRARAEKRGGGNARVTLTVSGFEEAGDPEILIALDEGLDKLAKEDPRAAEVARTRLFTGVEFAEIARALEVSERTVMREWAYARARLAELLGEASA